MGSDAFLEQKEFFTRHYQRVYRLEQDARDPEKPPETLTARLEIARAISYFLKNYDEFIFFTNPGQLDVPIDNNPQERLLRNPVIGRKTWYGTHSKQGAKTTAVH